MHKVIKSTLTAIVSLALLMSGNTMKAQTMVAEKMTAAPMDMSASVNKRVDFNGQPCALIKVSITASNASFGGNIIGDVLRDGSDYWVYVTAGTKMLQVKHPNYKTLLVAFPDLGIKSVEGRQTYLLDITLPYYAPPQVAETVAQPAKPAPATAAASTETKSEPYRMRTFKPIKVKDYTSLFFPLYGITLGKSTSSDALRLGFKDDNTFWEEHKVINAENMSFWCNMGTNHDNNTYSQINIRDVPKQWAEKFNIEKKMSYNEWLDFFRSIGCRIDISKEPTIGEFDGKDVMRADFRATTPDGKYFFDLHFNYGKEGTTPYSPGTLYNITMVALSNDVIASKLASSKGASAGVKPSTAIDMFFPIYGITLGKTTWKDMSDLGFNVRFYDEDSVVGEALGLDFWDHHKDKYFTNLHMVQSANMPVDWVKMGFQWGNSYDTWVRMLKDLGYAVVVKKQPTLEKFQDRDCFSADLSAVSPDGRLRIDLDFDYGDNGNTTSSPGTLYSIDMYAL